MVAAVPKGSLCMAYIDPYNLQYLSFSILQALAPLRVDPAINFSIMDLRRNVASEANPDRARFDEAAPGWRDHVDERGTSRSGMSLEFFNYWRNLASGLKFEHSRELPFVLNDGGAQLYRMVFFARHDLPKRIWSAVARGPNMELEH
jgi:three-Cys-motif partner protein